MEHSEIQIQIGSRSYPFGPRLRSWKDYARLNHFLTNALPITKPNIPEQTALI